MTFPRHFIALAIVTLVMPVSFATGKSYQQDEMLKEDMAFFVKGTGRTADVIPGTSTDRVGSIITQTGNEIVGSDGKGPVRQQMSWPWWCSITPRC